MIRQRGDKHMTLACALAAMLCCACAERAEQRASTSADSASTPADTPAGEPARDTTRPQDEDTLRADPAAGWTIGNTRVERDVSGTSTLIAVRTARHADFDRMVFDFGADAIPNYSIEYVDRPVRQCGSGDVVPLPGDAWLAIRFEPAYAHTEAGAPTVHARARETDLPNLKRLELICDFEAQVEWVAAVASPTPYVARELQAPSRLVLDVRHTGAR